MEKLGTVCIRCVSTLHRICIESRVFYPTISQRSCHVQQFTFSQNTAGQAVFNIQEFQTALSTLHSIGRQYILHEKSPYSVQTVCSYIAQNARWITGFYPTISQRSCHVKHSTCNQNVAIHSLFNIQEFQAAFSPLYFTVSKCILHGNSAYSVHTVCSYIAQNVRWITGVICNDIA